MCDETLVKIKSAIISLLGVISMAVPIEIFYHEEMPALVKHGNWIDLYAAKDYEYKAGESFLIDLGVTIIFPPGFEAWLVPRSSTFKHYGIIQTNGIGIIDQDYCGPEDVWKMPVYALRDGRIKKHTRIAQFRVIPSMCVDVSTTQTLGEKSRGGFGSTGI